MIAEILGAVLGAGVLGIGYLVWCLFENEAKESSNDQTQECSNNATEEHTR